MGIITVVGSDEGWPANPPPTTKLCPPHPFCPLGRHVPTNCTFLLATGGAGSSLDIAGVDCGATAVNLTLSNPATPSCNATYTPTIVPTPYGLAVVASDICFAFASTNSSIAQSMELWPTTPITIRALAVGFTAVQAPFTLRFTAPGGAAVDANVTTPIIPGRFTSTGVNLPSGGFFLPANTPGYTVQLLAFGPAPVTQLGSGVLLLQALAEFMLDIPTPDPNACAFDLGGAPGNDSVLSAAGIPDASCGSLAFHQPLHTGCPGTAVLRSNGNGIDLGATGTCPDNLATQLTLTPTAAFLLRSLSVGATGDGLDTTLPISITFALAAGGGNVTTVSLPVPYGRDDLVAAAFPGDGLELPAGSSWQVTVNATFTDRPISLRSVTIRWLEGSLLLP